MSGQEEDRAGASAAMLYLLRHAKAEPAAAAMTRAEDHARVLAPRGCEDARAMGAWMRGQAIAPELALISSSARTAETYDLLQPLAPAPRRRDLQDLYLAEPDQLLAILRGEAAARSILLVGHNPGLHALARHLSGDSTILQAGLPTCTLVGFHIDTGWADLAPRSARLVTIHRP